MNRTSSLRAADFTRAGTARLWLLAVLFFGVGDLLTTGVGLGVPGVAERSPVAVRFVRRYGLVALAGLKLLAFGACYAVWRIGRCPHRVGVPLGLAVLGTVVTAWNLGVILAVGSV